MGVWWCSSLKHQSISPHFFTPHPSTTLNQPDTNHELSPRSEMIIKAPVHTLSIFPSQIVGMERVVESVPGVRARKGRVSGQMWYLQISKTALIEMKPALWWKCRKILWPWKIWCCRSHTFKICLWITLPVMQVFSARVAWLVIKFIDNPYLTRTCSLIPVLSVLASRLIFLSYKYF